jgi:hypothetical protein
VFVTRRSLLTDLAAVLLLGWAGLIAYVSLPTVLSDDPLWDGGVSVLGVLLAVGHLAAAVGVERRAGWGRRLGLGMGGIGLFGSAAVLITIIPGLERAEALIGRLPILVLAIPAGMVVSYAVVVVALYRARDEFNQVETSSTRSTSGR